MPVQTPHSGSNTHLRTQTPQDRAARPLQDSHATQIAAAVGGGLVALALLLSQQLIAAVVVLVLTFLLAWPFEHGAGYKYIRIWRNDFRLRRNDTVRPTRRSPYVLDCEVRDIDGQFATFSDLTTGTDKVYFRIQGYRHSNDDPEERYYADLRVTEAFKTALAQTPQDLVWGSILGGRPFDPTPWAKTVETHYVNEQFRNAKSRLRDIVRTDPEAFSQLLQCVADDPTYTLRGEDARALQHENGGLAWNMTEQRGAEYQRIVYLCLNRPPEWQAIRDKDPGAFTTEMLRKSHLFRVFTALQEGLEAAGFMGVKLMTRTEVERFVFRGWNARTNSEARVGGYPTTLEQNVPEGAGTYIPFPLQAPTVTKEYIVTDGVYHTALIVTKFGKQYVMPGGMLALQAGLPRWTTVSVRVATASGRRDTWANRYKKNQRQAKIKVKYGNGYIPEQKDRDLATTDAESVDAIHRSGGRSVRMAITIIISATNPQQLEERVTDMEAILRGQLVKVRRERHRSLMLKLFKQVWGAES